MYYTKLSSLIMTYKIYKIHKIIFYVLLVVYYTKRV